MGKIFCLIYLNNYHKTTKNSPLVYFLDVLYYDFWRAPAAADTHKVCLLLHTELEVIITQGVIRAMSAGVARCPCNKDQK